MAVEHDLMVNPMAMGLRLAGTVEFAGAEGAAERCSGGQADGEGPRPVSAPRPWLAFNHGHMGMCMGATTGREVAHPVAGRPTQVDLAPFRPGGF